MQKGIIIIISLICSAFGIIGCQQTSDNTSDVYQSKTEQSAESSEIHDSFDEISSNGDLSFVSVDTSDGFVSESEQSENSSDAEESDEESEEILFSEDNSDFLVSAPDDEIGGGIVLPEIPFD